MNSEHPTLESLNDYVHGELDAGETSAVSAHLAQCDDCRLAHEQEVRLGEVLRAHARAEERELPLGFAERIFAAATEQPQQVSWSDRLSAFLRPAVALPLAACVALIAYFGYARTHGGVKTTTIDAAYYLEDHASLATTMPFAEGANLPMTLTADDATADEKTVDGGR
jgi:anti-sigma factor RsiW